MGGVLHQNVLIGVLGLIILLLLFVDMANLEPNVSFCQRGRRVVKNVFKALERQLVLEQLLVYDAKAKVDFICLFKMRVHFHDLSKGFLGVLKRVGALVKNTNAVPQLGVLGIAEMDKGFLVGRIGKLQVVHH